MTSKQDRNSSSSLEKDGPAKEAAKPRASRRQARPTSSEGKSSKSTAKDKTTSKPAAGEGAARKAPNETLASNKKNRGSKRSMAKETTAATATEMAGTTIMTRRTKRSTAKKPKAAPAAALTPAVQAAQLPRLQARLREEIAPTLMKEFGYSSAMQVPRLSKIVLNIGLGEALDNARAIESATKDIASISGQRPIVTRARKSIAAFKLREGMAVGLSVTLRGRRMFEFLDRLISSALPRIRDFNGLSRKAFDGRGNYAIGIREQVIFPEIDYNSIDRMRGMQVVIVNTARTDREGFRLLESLGVPFTRIDASSGAA